MVWLSIDSVMDHEGSLKLPLRRIWYEGSPMLWLVVGHEGRKLPDDGIIRFRDGRAQGNAFLLPDSSAPSPNPPFIPPLPHLPPPRHRLPPLPIPPQEPLHIPVAPIHPTLLHRLADLLSLLFGLDQSLVQALRRPGLELLVHEGLLGAPLML